jgi:hypothetical protein
METILNGLIFRREGTMDSERRRGRGGGAAAGFGGVIWFAGWLFTIGFANLVWWKVILGIVVWPYYLGLVLR